MRTERSRRARLARGLPQLCAAMALLGGPASAGPGRIRPEAICAAYDLHLVTLIEDHGRAGSMEGQALAAATMQVTDARVACRAGDIDRALRLYGDVSLDPPRVRPADWVLLR